MKCGFNAHCDHTREWHGSYCLYTESPFQAEFKPAVGIDQTKEFISFARNFSLRIVWVRILISLLFINFVSRIDFGVVQLDFVELLIACLPWSSWYLGSTTRASVPRLVGLIFIKIKIKKTSLSNWGSFCISQKVKWRPLKETNTMDSKKRNRIFEPISIYAW